MASAPGRLSGSWLQPGTPMAPAKSHLPLLPSGPDGVHELAPHGTRPSSPLAGCCPRKPRSRGQEFNPALADCGYRAPLPPHLARPIHKNGGERGIRTLETGFCPVYSLSRRAPSTNSAISPRCFALSPASVLYTVFRLNSRRRDHSILPRGGSRPALTGHEFFHCAPVVVRDHLRADQLIFLGPLAGQQHQVAVPGL